MRASPRLPVLTALLIMITLLTTAYGADSQKYSIEAYFYPVNPAVGEEVRLTLSIVAKASGEPVRGLSVVVKYSVTIAGVKQTIIKQASEHEAGYYVATLQFTDEGENSIEVEVYDGEEKEVFPLSVIVLPPREPTKHMMPGMPDWLFLTSSGMAVLVSFLVVEAYSKRIGEKPYRRYNILRNRIIKRWVKSRKFQFTLRVPTVAAFILVILAGFFGSQDPSSNIATSLTWIFWWIVLIFTVMFLGRVFCASCPWLAISDWIQKLSLWGRKTRQFTLGLRWPTRFKTILIAAALFILLTWLELAIGVTKSPIQTAYLGLIILGLTLGSMLLFERNYFCRYGCPIGAIQGAYSLMSPVELKAESLEVCKNCKTKDCIRGNEKGYGCPTYTYVGSENSATSTSCILCSECVKTCPHDNVAFNFRPFLKDLTSSFTPSHAWALFAVVILALTSFHGLTMIPTWGLLISLTEPYLGYIGSFTLWMFLFLGFLIGVVYFFVYLARLMSGTTLLNTRTLFTYFAISFLPIALFYHAAHNVAHFNMEFMGFIKALSDPFGYGWNLFGTANIQVAPITSMDYVWYMQAFLIILGHILAVYVSTKIAHRIYPTHSQAFRSQIPITTLMIFYTMFSLWLTAQPMVMRTSM